MTAFTRLGSSIWDWEPWTELGAQARILWLALYTSAEAKRHVPGLWQGGIPSMADAARMPPDDVIGALDQLLARELVEYDAKLRVLRLCELPDTGEYPSNGKVIKGWWTKFHTVPACAVRDAHVRTIAWILETGSRRLRGISQEVSENHQAAWRETFGTIVIPPSRRRGVRRLADSDTATSVQPSLFPSPSSGASPVLSLPAGSVPVGISQPSSGEPSYPQNPQVPVDNSVSVRQMNEIRGPETVSYTVSDTVSYTNRIPDPGSRIPDLSSLSGGRGLGGGHETGMRPALTLVPPFSAASVLQELARGVWDESLDKAYQDALGALIAVWAAGAVTLADFAVLAEYNRHISRRWNARLLVGCDIHAEISTAKRSLDWRDVRVANLRES